MSKFIGFWTIAGVLLLLLGLSQIRSGGNKKGYLILAIGALCLTGGNFAVVVALILIVLGLFYKNAKNSNPGGDFIHKQSFLSSIRHDREPWVLRNMSVWNLIGEMRFDLSLAILEEKEATMVLQGVIGDLDIVVPDELGLLVEGTVYVGQIAIDGMKREGVVNRLSWRSPNYESAAVKVKLIVTYYVGDVKIKIV
ncbi:cell wall-active antibiotics response protein LiaF [Gorillibacterium massiliense]|uniref:cell wall-active antibiotics response protein LiaF n=1 Tax=Gorillibacterium massiliense TaxID=1280390 RepID=UPI001EE176F2|nr:cell wall-active antibiotics response protein LiaF [Gorillibacterium massiliense]